jgi:hypothetical protein
LALLACLISFAKIEGSAAKKPARSQRAGKKRK